MCGLDIYKYFIYLYNNYLIDIRRMIRDEINKGEFSMDSKFL